MIEAKIFPTRVNTKILASTDINPDTSNRPSPLVVRVYELKTINAFDSTNFFKLYDEENTILGNDLLSREEFQILPGQERSIDRKVHKQTRYLAVIAAFRNIEKAQWRVSKVLEPNHNNTFVITINKHNVSISNQQ